MLVDLALKQQYGIITTLPFSRYSSPIFAQRNSKGKLRILVDLRRTNHLIKHDYGEHNHSVTAISQAAQHMAGKTYFCKLDCSKAYHCIEKADEHSVQLLYFNFGSRTFANQCLAQCLHRSLSVFTSVTREYLYSVVKMDWCVQYVDDIGVAAHTASELIKKFDIVFKQNPESKIGLEIIHQKMSISLKFNWIFTEVLLHNINCTIRATNNEVSEKNLKLTSNVETLQC